MREIERCVDASQESLQPFVRASRPVVLERVAAHWPALSKWTDDHFRAVAGDTEVEALVGLNGRLSTSETHGFERKRISVREALTEFSRDAGTGPHLYIGQQPVESISPTLLSGIEVPEVLADKRLSSRNIWMGPAGHVTQLHFDQSHNLLIQVSGHKRLVLFPPRTPLKPYPNEALSNVASRAPHSSLLRRASQTVLAPGDGLFIPAYWWHEVTSLDRAISINFWWGPRLRELPSHAVWRQLPAILRRRLIS